MKHLLNILFLVSCIAVNAQIGNFRHVYGGNGDDFARDIEQTSDGGYIITGATGSFGWGQSDVYLLKIDSAGNYEWSRSYGGHNVDWGSDVEIMADDGYIIAGYTNSFGSGGYDFYLLRTNSMGDTLWTKTYGGWDWDHCYSLQITYDSNFVMAGETYSYGNGERDIWVVKADQNGDTIWTKTFGGILDESAKEVIETIDSNLVIAGYSYTYTDGSADGLLLSLSPTGDVNFYSNYGGTELQEFNSIVQYYDTTGFICFGTTHLNQSQTKMYMVKFDNTGTFEWDKLYGNGLINTGSVVNKRAGNSMIIIGTNDNDNNDIEALVTGPTGGQWSGNSHLGGDLPDEGIDIILNTDNDLTILGNTTSFGQGYSDILVYKATTSIDSDSSGYVSISDTNTVIHELTSTAEDLEKGYLEIYPNPTNGIVLIRSNDMINKIVVSNYLGQSLKSEEPNAYDHSADLSPLKKGVYFVTIETRQSTVTKKVILK